MFLELMVMVMSMVYVISLVDDVDTSLLFF